MEKNKDILKYWNYEKNQNDDPSNYLPGSGKVVWWKCDKGHEWKQQIYQFSQKKEKCPYCSNRELLIGFNDFATCHKELLEEWNYTKNKIKPNEILESSTKKVWWICKNCNKDWETSVYIRSKGHGCPHCGHKTVGVSNSKIKDSNKSLIKVFPDVIRVWNYEKNGNLKPEDFLSKSNKKVWWKCTICGKEWESTICAKSHTTICKECTYTNNNRTYVKKGSNDLATKYPDLLMEWDYEKNIIKPDEIAFSSAKKVWWKCEKGHVWESSPLSRIKRDSKPNQCPFCSNQKLLPGFNDFATICPELLKEWDYAKNKKTPNQIIRGSNLKAYWLCDKGHSYEASIGRRMAGTGCPFCAGQKVLKGFNDLQSQYPEIAKEWDYNKNKIKPDEIAAKSGKNVWWICDNGHSWKSIVVNRTKNGGRGCPTCANRTVLKGFNDLATTNPNLLKEWDYSKNKIKPDEVIAGSTEKAWWICDRGHSWSATIVSRTKNHFCPICNSSKQTSISEKSIVYYLKKYNIDLIESYKIKRKEIDIFIPSINTGIEYDGQYYHKDIKRDLLKNELCNSLGIKLIRIREPELPKLNSTSIDFIIDELTSDHSYMDKIIKKLLDYLGIKKYDVDVERDFNEIYSLYQKGEKKESIQLNYPELMEEWDYEKNTISPEQVSKGTHISVWWKCKKCNYSWEAKVYARCAGSGCPNCAGVIDKKKPSKLQKGINDFATEHREFLEEWDYDKNTIKPNELTSGSTIKVWWKCKLNHSYAAAIVNRLKGTACPYCANKKILKGYNDLLTTNPELAKEWNYTKNKLNPSEVFAGTGKKVWWKCDKGHEWEAQISSRASGSGCPICSGRQTLEGYNDLATTNPELIELWDYTKNIIKPTEVSKGTHTLVWWKCNICNGSYQRKIYQQVTRKGKCPLCKSKK